MANGYTCNTYYNNTYSNYTTITLSGNRYGWEYGQVHGQYRYTISTLSIEDNEEIENEFDIDLCCSTCMKISGDKFAILHDACIKGKTFLIPATINGNAAFMAWVFANNIETR